MTLQEIYRKRGEYCRKHVNTNGLRLLVHPETWDDFLRQMITQGLYYEVTRGKDGLAPTVMGMPVIETTQVDTWQVVEDV